MSLDDERVRVAAHIAEARALAAEARQVRLPEHADAIDSAAQHYRDAWEDVERARADLAVFTVDTAGVSFGSKDRKERGLISKEMHARRRTLAAFHSLSRAGDRYHAVIDRLRERLADEDPPRDVGPPTTRARETLAGLPAVLSALKGHRITKTSVSTGLEVDRNTLNAWIANGWMTWPPSD